MPSDVSHVCCGMRPDRCHSIMPEMDLSITDKGVLQFQQLYKNNMLRHSAVIEEDINASMRQTFGKLGMV
ncbi:hypothetical protein ACF0H5_002294 [Mactra antiquata]